MEICRIYYTCRQATQGAVFIRSRIQFKQLVHAVFIYCKYQGISFFV